MEDYIRQGQAKSPGRTCGKLEKGSEKSNGHCKQMRGWAHPEQQEQQQKEKLKKTLPGTQFSTLATQRAEDTFLKRFTAVVAQQVRICEGHSQETRAKVRDQAET